MSVPFANDAVKNILHIAAAIARENYNPDYGAPHLLRALMHPDTGMQDFLRTLDKDPAYFMDWAEVRIEEYRKTNTLPEVAEQNEEIERLLDEADEVRLKLGLGEISALCLLTALVKPHVVFTSLQLKSLPLRESEILSLFESKEQNKIQNVSELMTGANQQHRPDGALRKYCIDKTILAAKGNIDPIIGRERETRMLIEILGRRNKPNVIITGEPGVGKTALADGLAFEINANNVPLHLQKAILLELDLGALMAGASYKGEIEDRLKKVITELKTLDKAILFIDEIHQLLDSKGSLGTGTANLLKPELARGAITVIGATTQEEYRKIIEPDQAFSRRFEVLPILEPTEEICCKMVAFLAPKYEAHHKIAVAPDAVAECVRLSKRYLKEKRLPDAALDLLDRTMAAIRMLEETSLSELQLWKEKFDALKTDHHTDSTTAIKEYRWCYQLLQNMVSPILWGSLEEQPDISRIENIAALQAILEQTYTVLTRFSKIKSDTVGKLELAAVMAAKTGIPLGKIQAQEKEKLLNMESLLMKRVIGQDHALKVLSDAIIESRSGINKPGQPIGSFFLLGPTGTGKTELAKSIAELLFNDEKAMIRFDMSEFKEEHSAALLYGAPPGYVGYEEGGMLVNKIRQQPYSVVLFDEIEKAHPSVFDVFLQIMDEGKIMDKLGKEGDFSNALILFTSNVGSQHVIEKFEQQKIPTSRELMSIMAQNFRPEFLARITEILPFAPISDEMAVRIFDKQLKTLIRPLQQMGINFTISIDAKKQLALSGFSTQYGARQIDGVIRSQLSRPVSKMIVREQVKNGDTIQVSLNADGLLDWLVTSNVETK
ncbi:ATP-dependent Clp protease ATP-binding subunit [Taibaiella soli]|uniref:ATP-dependent Clp protease ATP-binding subunit n=1 Tax=Taibaiella soli TaxID=1649169 RepID=A0A2W2AGT9_9BACT|nr:ATP-dependent Clp protease ATP-binding subunit [Taibaiella soli]PZF72742.1 ATP-dependent Clp protease ATP-binding subunit [Taibaiella soli]